MSTGVREEELTYPTPTDPTEEEALLLPHVERMVRELTLGAEASNKTLVRAGAICMGEGELLAHQSGGIGHSRVLHALSLAQMRTGAPLFLPVPSRGSGAAEEFVTQLLTSLRSLFHHGASAERVVLTHAQNLLLSDSSPHFALRDLLAQGVTLTFDGLGNSWSVMGAHAEEDDMTLPPPENLVAQAVASLVADGFGPQLMLSHGLSSQLQFRALGGGGLVHLQACFLPRLRRLGVSENEVEMMTQTNARRLLWVSAEIKALQ